MPVDEPNLIFTRYLYPKYNVKQSFLFALLERQLDEALFWGYELYFSGFQEEILDFVKKIYDMLYHVRNPKFSSFLEKMLNSESEPDTRLASIVVSMINNPYDLSKFVETICHGKCKPHETSEISTKKQINIVVSEDYIEKYKTIFPGTLPPHRILQTACRYPIRSNIAKLFEFELEFETMHHYFTKHWVYYASRSPTWEARVRELGAEMDDETKEISFPNDDAEEKFYETWGYNPDEQPMDLRKRCIGDSDIEQMTMAEFCQRFGVTVVPKKRLVIKTEEDPLNSIIIT
jgi:hypothetical protein